jgi:hypothetical protein
MKKNDKTTRDASGSTAARRLKQVAHYAKIAVIVILLVIGALLYIASAVTRSVAYLLVGRRRNAWKELRKACNIG